MSENLDKVKGIRHLPLFPLPLVVLPGELVPLHIFEPRYRKLLGDVMADQKIFGITLFEPGATIDRPPLSSVGCAVEVREVEMLRDARSNILTSGLTRYRLIDYVETGEPYFVGDVEFFEDDPDESAELEQLADEVFEIFERIAKAAFRIGGSRGQFPEIERTDPEVLSFLITAAFNFDNERKYRLLEMQVTRERLIDLKEVLVKTVDQMEESAEIQVRARSNGHSKKKIDL